MIYSDAAGDKTHNREELFFRPSLVDSDMLRPITQPHRRKFVVRLNRSTNKPKGYHEMSQEPDFEEATFLKMED